MLENITQVHQNTTDTKLSKRTQTQLFIEVSKIAYPCS
jgi:hypothetical protein